MNPLYSSDCRLVAWISAPSVFDVSMRPVAYLSSGHAWSLAEAEWLGPVDGLNLLDPLGKPVAWNPGQALRGALVAATPMAPKRPIRPKTPMRPKTPLPPGKPLPPMGGWSHLTFHAWARLGCDPLSSQESLPLETG